jgi:hypothetical protein
MRHCNKLIVDMHIVMISVCLLMLPMLAEVVRRQQATRELDWIYDHVQMSEQTIIINNILIRRCIAEE